MSQFDSGAAANLCDGRRLWSIFAIPALFGRLRCQKGRWVRRPIGHNAGSEVPAMNLLKTSRQRLLPALIACLVGATWAIPAVPAPPFRCYADPVPGEASNSQTVNYNRGLDAQPDPWGSPGTPPIGGAFACSKPGNCDLRTVMEEPSTCALLVIKGGNLE